MIKNEVQYKLTKTSVEGFEKRLNWLKANPEARGDLDPIIARAEEEALESMIEELNEELQDYNRTKAGHVDIEVLYSVDKIAGVLISARIAKGFTQRQLASMVGLKEQQIQRYEARGLCQRGLEPGTGDSQGPDSGSTGRDRSAAVVWIDGQDGRKTPVFRALRNRARRTPACPLTRFAFTLSWASKTAFKQSVQLKPCEGPGSLAPTASHYLGSCQF